MANEYPNNKQNHAKPDLPLCRHLRRNEAALAPAAAAVSDSQADAIVAAEAAAEITRKIERRARLLEVPAIRETEFRQGERTVVVRRVALPPRLDASEAEIEESAAGNQEGESTPPAFDPRPEINLTLLVTVAGDTSEIRSRDIDSGNEYILTSAITHLPVVATVATPNARYTFFSIVSQAGAITTRRTLGDSVRSFTAPGKYTIYSDVAPISESFKSAIAALYEHHLEHQAEWKAEAEYAKALQAARERYQAQNQPPPRETTINIWRIDPASGDRD
ncbi:MAG: hypothetical protein WD490_05650 [Opitutales bacterium]